MVFVRFLLYTLACPLYQYTTIMGLKQFQVFSFMKTTAVVHIFTNTIALFTNTN